MSTLTFADTHNMVAFLEKLAESDGFHEIIDFLNANQIHYALTINPIIYTSCIQQFWATEKANTINGERQLQAIIDKKKVIITESSIRSDLHLEDAGAVLFLRNGKFLNSYHYQCLSAKSTAWNEFSSTMAFLIICLATNQKFNLSKYILDAMVKHLDGGVKFLMYPRFLQVFINQQLGDMSHHKKIYVNPSHIKKIFANMRREGKDFLEERKQRKDTAVTQEETQQDDSVPTPSNEPPLSSEDSMQLSELMILCTNMQKHVLDLEKAKDAQAKEIVDLKKRVQKLERKKKSRTTGLKRLRKVVDDTQGRSDDADIFDINDLHGDEVNVDMPVGEKQEQSLKSKSYEEIQKMFDNEMRRVNTFIPMDSEVDKSKKETKESSKRTEDELKSDKSKKAESIDDEAELKKHLVIVKDDDIAIDAIPLATKPPVIVEYKLLKEGIMAHYQLIRADTSFKRYSLMIRMLQDISREDLQTL
ncbi:hypothetical protein Tco_0616126 [Tanacetum coccineum]